MLKEYRHYSQYRGESDAAICGFELGIYGYSLHNDPEDIGFLSHVAVHSKEGINCRKCRRLMKMSDEQLEKRRTAKRLQEVA